MQSYLKMKKTIIGIVIAIIVFGVILVISQKKTYTIRYELIDDYTTDIRIIVLQNNKEFTDYKYIKYNDNSNIILCNSSNSIVNKFEVKDIRDLIIVLDDNKEVIAKTENLIEEPKKG